LVDPGAVRRRVPETKGSRGDANIVKVVSPARAELLGLQPTKEAPQLPRLSERSLAGFDGDVNESRTRGVAAGGKGGGGEAPDTGKKANKKRPRATSSSPSGQVEASTTASYSPGPAGSSGQKTEGGGSGTKQPSAGGLEIDDLIELKVSGLGQGIPGPTSIPLPVYATGRCNNFCLLVDQVGPTFCPLGAPCCSYQFHPCFTENSHIICAPLRASRRGMPSTLPQLPLKRSR